MVYFSFSVNKHVGCMFNRYMTLLRRS